MQHVTDHTLGLGDAASEAAAHHISYAGLAFTDEHKNETWKKLHMDTLQHFCSEGLPCSNPKAASVFGDELKANASPDTSPGAMVPPNDKPGAKPKPGGTKPGGTKPKPGGKKPKPGKKDDGADDSEDSNDDSEISDDSEASKSGDKAAWDLQG